MALGGLLSAVFLIITLYKQQKNFKITKFENRYFEMINNLIITIGSCKYTTKIEGTDKNYQGIEVLKFLSGLYIDAIKKTHCVR